MKTNNVKHNKTAIMMAVAVAFGISVVVSSTSLMAAPPKAKNGTTLAADKTIDICEYEPAELNSDNEIITPAKWKYSGEVAVWNDGLLTTSGLAIKDCIQFKAFDSSGQFADVPDLCQDLRVTEVDSYSVTNGVGKVFEYSMLGDPLNGYIRNSAKVTILNHSGSIGTPTGPNPKRTYLGTLSPLPCDTGTDKGCTYTQGYWGHKPDVTWPVIYAEDGVTLIGYYQANIFYRSGQTWQEVFDTAPAGGNNYYKLAHQFMSAKLNKAKGAFVPDGIQEILDDAEVWFTMNTQGTPKRTGQTAIPATGCYVPGSCGVQGAQADILDTYNRGVYEGGPEHCADEVLPSDE